MFLANSGFVWFCWNSCLWFEFWFLSCECWVLFIKWFINFQYTEYLFTVDLCVHKESLNGFYINFSSFLSFETLNTQKNIEYRSSQILFDAGNPVMCKTDMVTSSLAGTYCSVWETVKKVDKWICSYKLINNINVVCFQWPSSVAW